MTEAVNNSNVTSRLNASAEAATGKDKREKDLRNACAGFEGMFLSMMMKTMRQATETLKSGLVETSKGEEIFTEMLDQEYVDAASKSGSTGLGDMLYKHIISTSEEYADLRENGGERKIDADISKLKRLKEDSLSDDRKGIGLNLTY